MGLRAPRGAGTTLAPIPEAQCALCFYRIGEQFQIGTTMAKPNLLNAHSLRIGIRDDPLVIRERARSKAINETTMIVPSSPDLVMRLAARPAMA